jgi:hypothetical protein
VARLLRAESYLLALDGLGDILHLAGPNAEAAEAVLQAIARHGGPRSLRPAMEGEVVMLGGTMTVMREAVETDGAAALHGLLSSSDEDEPGRKAKSLTAEEREFAHQILDAAEALALRRLRQRLLQADRPYYERGNGREPKEPGPDEPSGPVEEISDLLVGSERGHEVPARMEARQQVVRATAATLAYRAGRGAFPERLEAALPEPPLDPFTGRPLEYRRERGGFVVYSAGPRGSERSGRPGERASGQVHFRYPRPQAPARRSEGEAPGR